MQQTVGWGVGVPPQLIWQHGDWMAEQLLDLLRPECWHNWDPDPVLERPGFMPMIYGRHWSPLEVQRLVAHPGETWLLWNEPERRDQSNVRAAEAVDLTKEFLLQAWATGKPFRWAAPGVWVGPCEHGQDGLAWLSEYVTAPMGLRLQGVQRPTYWHIHSYRSGSLDTFKASWQRWNVWYSTWGASAPVILSEVCAEAGNLDAQMAVMRETRDMLDRGEIVASMWFASHRHEAANWPQCALTDYDTTARRVTLNALGRYWLELR